MLKDKIALVTGGSRGIGRSIALKLAENGAKIAINYANNSEKADGVIEEIKDLGVDAISIKADVSSEEDVKSLIKSVEKDLGKIDILVNNAGITRDNLLIRMKTEDFEDVLDVNLKGTFLCTKAVSRAMMKKKYGKIINITSVVGIVGNAGQANYSASKAGVIGFTKSIAKELASRGIRVNAVAPGFIDTEMTQVLSEEIKEQMLEGIPLNELGDAEDVANTVVFLASNKSDYITGQVISVDGGMAI